MKRKNKTKKIPAYLTGLEGLLLSSSGINLQTILGQANGENGLSGVAGTTNVANNGNPLLSLGQTAIPAITSKLGLGEDTSTFVNSVGSTALTGASVGGPIGAGIGAGIGLAKGMIGVNSNKRRREQMRRERRRQQDVQTLGQLNSLSNEMAYDYYQENNIVPTFAYGGISNNNLAYLDHNEIIRTPDGNVSQVISQNPNGTDNVLTNIPEGTSILSDQVKIPNTRKTFADIGKQIEKRYTKGSNNTGYYANNTSKLNNLNMNREIDSLVTLQELVKNRKGLSTNYKNAPSDIPAYATGLRGINFLPLDDTVNPNDLLALGQPQLRQTPDQWSLAEQLSVTENTPIQTRSLLNTSSKVPSKISNTIQSTNNGQSIWGGVENVLTDYLSLAPVNYNYRMGNQPVEVESAINNPYGSEIRSSMRRRRYSPYQAIERNRINSSIGNYNANAITNTGQNLAFRLANSVAERRSNNEIFNQASNINNQYAADYSNTLNNLGQQNVAAITSANEINRRNRAARENYTATANSQLGQWSQNRQLMNNQQNRDNQRLGIWNILARYGLTERDLESVNNLINR